MARRLVKRNVQYKPMLVTYVDILGFEGLIRTRTANEISRILRVFEEETAPPRYHHKVPDMAEEEHVSFADLNMTLTHLSGPGAKGIVFHQFFRMVHAQLNLLLDHGVLVRGGITIGDATRSYRKYYGPAVVEAVRLEERRPHYPCIIVDPTVLAEIEVNPRLWMHDQADELNTIRGLLTTVRGVTFIDYLKVGYGEVEDGDRLLDAHESFVKKRMTEFAHIPRVLAKYRWLLKYHQRTARTLAQTARARPRQPRG